MSTTSSTPMPATGSLQLVEAVIERFDGAAVGERRRWSDEFKAQAVTAALEPGVNVSGLARRLGISPPQLFGWRKAFLKKQDADVPAAVSYTHLDVYKRQAHGLAGACRSANPATGVTVRPDRYPFQRQGSRSSTLLIL